MDPRTIKWLQQFDTLEDVHKAQTRIYVATGKQVPYITQEEWDTHKEDKMPEYVTSDAFARHEMMDREVYDRVTIVETDLKNHMKNYEQMRNEQRDTAKAVHRIEAKLSNGITEKLNAVVEASQNACDADKVRLILQEENGKNKKRGREWLALVTGLCAVATTVIGLVL